MESPKVLIVTERREFAVLSSIAIIRPRTEVVDPRYLVWALRDPATVSQSERNKTGSAVRRIILSDLKKIQIPLPPLPEQRRIAAILDQADALRTKRRRALTLLDELAEALFVDIFGDPVNRADKREWTTIGQLVDSANYGTSSKAGAEGAYPVLRMRNMTRTGRLDLSNLKYIDLTDSEKPKYLVHKGDVLFNRTNSVDLVGKSVFYDRDEPLAYAGYLVRLRPNERNTGEYIAAFLNTRYAKTKLRSMAKSIVGMANINAQEVKAMAIPTASYDLQMEFVSRLRSIRSLRLGIGSELESWNALFASLQHRAFRGEL